MFRKIVLSLWLLVLLAGCGLRRTETANSASGGAAGTAVPTASVVEEMLEVPTERVMEEIPSTPTQAVHTHSADVASPLIESMSHEHLHAEPHIQLTGSRALTQEDIERADEVASAAREALGKYSDYRQALEDGYVIFGENIPQDVYHFINYRETLANLSSFDPARPTALLYKKLNDEWEFMGAMYSAPWGSTEEELDARYPLSMAQWHAHVNICVPRDLQDLESLADNPTFGFEGSIDTEEECSAAGGRFFPDVLGWMVHVYLYAG